ncbi:DedA family protein [Actinotalea subterranea]|uniref:DedA family protein n=1 Tax=Actinotalea subterranea TaxID=2607497 RepID=UPI001FE38650|nr:DedA family protein [Actinotalea subterranea]
MLEDWVIALAGSPWVFLALYAFAAIDGFFPPIPSESVVIALAALSAATGEPNFWILGAVAAAGAFTGDQTAYSIGQRLSVRRMRMMRGPRQQRALAWAERALEDRGASFIIAARYVPVGRVAVNMTAGTVGFSRPRFSALAAIAAVTWSIYSVMLGIGAGVWLGENPMLAVAVGVAGGVLLGLLLDPVISWFARRRGGRTRVTGTADAVSAAEPGDAASDAPLEDAQGATARR